MKNILQKDYNAEISDDTDIAYSIETYINQLWHENNDIYELLKNADSLEDARIALHKHLSDFEEDLLKIENDNNMLILEKTTVRDCINALISITATINEHRTEYSALDALWKLANDDVSDVKETISKGFMLEFIHLFRGLRGASDIYREEENKADFLDLQGREAAVARTNSLDVISAQMTEYFYKFPSGLLDDVIKRREENRDKILKYFGGTQEDWLDYKWHLKNVIKTAQPIIDLIKMPEEQIANIKLLTENHIPFGITPYYLSLMDNEPSEFDHCVRNMVLPPNRYAKTMAANRDVRDEVFDFMGEGDTSPIDLITRRYPRIAILKPYNTCAQICVYCQRNWEIDEAMDPKAMHCQNEIEDALQWIKDHPSIGDVLVTGGDPAVMNDKQIDNVLKRVAEIDHVYRIRFGTRTPVVNPQRWTDDLIEVISKYNVPGKREVSVITHFEHPYEITPEAMKAVQKIRCAGMSVYNQEVFTIDNSRRFESCKLRRDLKSIGIDPYYTFNMKGKDETKDYMVPIARILQERKEEARLLPGLDRTDEPVFNVPRLGKNHLRAGQDHKLVMIKPDGARVYEMHPWEKNITPVKPYNYTDKPIYDYLSQLKERGEDLEDYRTIWYYF
ncbi:MAG: KamA family radical SAM protein [Alphaproteobacteria bacterium]|nr:KamA family radical SAM protein [Alphaproteobacteria bacterium]